MQIQILTILLVTPLILGLHLQTANVYNPQQYQQSLAQTQQQLKADLQQIQAQFGQLDQQLAQAADDPYDRLRIYQEGIADERDSLYRIQQYLTLPYNQRACQCINFTSELRDKLGAQLQSVNESLGKLKNEASECEDCGITVQIRRQIQIQEGYLQTMSDTLNAKCCQKYQILYTDNLKASNWLTGGRTSQQYKQWMNDQVESAKQSTDNDTLVKSCPLANPYSQPGLQSCTQCEQPQLFNLYSRECEQCPPGQIFDYLAHICRYNVSCPIGSEFNSASMLCEKIESPTNSSFCPPEAPVWNPKLLGCFRCNRTLPYFNNTINQCTACPTSYIYNNVTNQCRYPACTPKQIFNPRTQVCEDMQVTPVTPVDDGSSSECPANRPYWDRDSLSCVRCHSQTPFYNMSTKTCEKCPANSTYNPNSQSCTKQCPKGTSLNSQTMQCQNRTSVSSVDGQVSVCPPQKPIWNDQTKSCEVCGSSQPYWNGNSCQKCPLTQTLNPSTGQCEQTVVEKNITCPDGTAWDNNTQQCQQVNGSSAECPPDRPFYNPSILGCTFCPTSAPYYNEATRQCSTSLNPGNGSLPSQSCPQSAPMWDAIRQACVSCGSGLIWDPVLKACTLTTMSTTCPYNQQFNTTSMSCEKCKPYQKFNNNTKKCMSFCRPGQTYNSNLDICSGTVSRCPVGLVFDQGELRCECPQGVNWKYNERSRDCSKVCKDGEEYQYLDGKCYPV